MTGRETQQSYFHTYLLKELSVSKMPNKEKSKSLQMAGSLGPIKNSEAVHLN